MTTTMYDAAGKPTMVTRVAIGPAATAAAKGETWMRLRGLLNDVGDGLAAFALPAVTMAAAVASCAAMGTGCVTLIGCVHMLWLAADIFLTLAIDTLNRCLHPPRIITQAVGGGRRGGRECDNIGW